MHTDFFNRLILGRKYEEEVAQWFESQGFNVWRIGNFRLPIDLFVWNDGIEFGVEVKYRSDGKPARIGEKKLLDFLGESKIPAYVITICPDSISWTVEWKERPETVDKEILVIKREIEKHPERAKGGNLMIEFLIRRRNTPNPKPLGNYRKITWI